MSEKGPGEFNNENQENPFMKVVKMEVEIEDSLEKLKGLYELYNSIVAKWNANPGIFNVVGKMEVELKLKKVEEEIRNIEKEVNATTEELVSIVEKMQKEN